MLSDLNSVLNKICWRTLQKDERDCPRVMFPTNKILPPLSEIVAELGDLETSLESYNGPDLKVVVRLAIRTICRTESNLALRILDENGRNAVREAASRVERSVEWMRSVNLDYGPLPLGLDGRSLGFAALAFGVLEPRLLTAHIRLVN